MNHLVRTRATGPGEPAASGVLVDRTPLVTLATKVGATALVTGASGSDATGMILRLGLTHGVRFQVDVTYTSVVVGWPDGDGVPLTMLRTVPALDRDYARLAHLHAVVDAVADGSLSVADATVELDRRGATGFTYRRWVLWLAAFVQGASICALLGGAALEILAAGFTTFLIEVTTGWMTRRQAPYFFAQVAAGALPAAVATVLMYLRGHGVPELWGLSPSLVVASGMVSMLAGMGIVGAAQDALDGYYLTANARIVDLMMRTGGLILGVAGVLWLGVRVGAPAYLSPEAVPLPPAPLQVLAAATFSLVFAIGGRLGPRGVLLAAGFGGLGWTFYLVSLPLVGADHAVAAGGAATVMAVVAHIASSRLRLPAIALVTLGIAPLMPGMLLYRGLFRLVVGQPAVNPGDAAGELLLMAALTGVALALGSSVGSIVGRQLALPTERVARLAAVASLRRGRLRR